MVASISIRLGREATGPTNDGFDQQRGDEPAHGGPKTASNE